MFFEILFFGLVAHLVDFIHVDMLNFVFDGMALCGEAMRDDQIIVFLFVDFIDGMKVAATGSPTENFVGHLIFYDRKESFVELEQIIDFLLMVMTYFFQLNNFLFTFVHDFFQPSILLQQSLHVDALTCIAFLLKKVIY